jgi:BolA protein
MMSQGAARGTGDNTMTDTQTPTRAARLHAKLTEAFNPSRMEIVDESAKHAGHVGARDGSETHFKITLVSDAFKNRTRIERSRMVHAALVSEFTTGLHALSLNLNSSAE